MLFAAASTQATFTQGLILGGVVGVVIGAGVMLAWVMRPTRTRHHTDLDVPPLLKPATQTVHVDNVVDPIDYRLGHLGTASERLEMMEKMRREGLAEGQAQASAAGVFDWQADTSHRKLKE